MRDFRSRGVLGVMILVLGGVLCLGPSQRVGAEDDPGVRVVRNISDVELWLAAKQIAGPAGVKVDVERRLRRKRIDLSIDAPLVTALEMLAGAAGGHLWRIAENHYAIRTEAQPESSLPEAAPEEPTPADADPDESGGSDSARRREAEALAEKLLQSVKAVCSDETFSAIVEEAPNAALWLETLSQFPTVLRRVATCCHECAVTLAYRDGGDAATFLAWVAEAGKCAHEAAPADIDALCARTYAEVAALRAAVARGQETPSASWQDAAERILTYYEKNKDDGCAMCLALELLREACCQDDVLVIPFLESASTLCNRARKLYPEDSKVALAVAASYHDQVHRGLSSSPRRSQVALRGYFKTMEGLQDEGGLPGDATIEWNQLITFARSNKLTSNYDYLARTIPVAENLVAVSVPLLDRWIATRASIEESFESRQLHRSITFKVYDWDMVYSIGVHEVHGDNPKGLAHLLLELKQNDYDQAKVRRKPYRMRLTSGLPKGILFVIEGYGRTGYLCRTRHFFFKVVKAEKTVALRIDEALDVPELDPEFDDVLESLVITKTRR